MRGQAPVLLCARGHKSILTSDDLEQAFGYDTAVDIETELILDPLLPVEHCPECPEMSAPMAKVIPFPMHRVRPV